MEVRGVVRCTVYKITIEAILLLVRVRKEQNIFNKNNRNTNTKNDSNCIKVDKQTHHKTKAREGERE